MTDIIERLNDEEMYVDAIDDAIHEIELLRELLKDCLPFVKDMVGIASSARRVTWEVESYLSMGMPCSHGYFDTDLCPDCRH